MTRQHAERQGQSKHGTQTSCLRKKRLAAFNKDEATRREIFFKHRLNFSPFSPSKRQSTHESVATHLNEPPTSAMKHLFSFLFLFCSLLAVQAAAQDIRNSSNSLIATLSSDGTVRGANNQLVAKISSDGRVRGTNNVSIAQLSSSGDIRSASNALLGRVSGDGTVRDSSNRNLGRIHSDGTVRDSNNRCVGYARGVKPVVAAWLFFFAELK